MSVTNHNNSGRGLPGPILGIKIYRDMKSVEIKVEDTGQDRVEESNPKQFRLPHAGDGKIITARKYQYEKVN